MRVQGPCAGSNSRRRPSPDATFAFAERLCFRPRDGDTCLRNMLAEVQLLSEVPLGCACWMHDLDSKTKDAEFDSLAPRYFAATRWSRIRLIRGLKWVRLPLLRPLDRKLGLRGARLRPEFLHTRL